MEAVGLVVGTVVGFAAVVGGLIYWIVKKSPRS